MYNVEVNGNQYRIEYGPNHRSVNDKAADFDLIEYREGRFHIIMNNKSYTAEVVQVNSEEKSFVINVNNRPYRLQVRDRYDDLLREMGIDPAAGKKVNDMKAPMPGLVLGVMVTENQPVSKGDPVLVLEAMKME
ncbi:MAG: biotin/lipoyl-containing protein, partial [Flavobacteriales bacterium]